MRHSYDEARSAKQKLGRQLSTLPELAGIGLTEVSDDYAVQVMLTRPVRDGIIPDRIDGVPVAIAVVGAVQAL